jgi:hypothetical protein
VKRLHCPVCANEVFFDSLTCVRSGTELALRVGAGGSIEVHDVASITPCARRATWRCNWEVEVPGEHVCPSCALVDDGGHGANLLMVPFQSAQRRALYQLTLFGLPWKATETGGALRFAFRSSAVGDPAIIGHSSGEITLDLEEADPARREQIRATLGEHYRTPLGHIRHELGHFVWMMRVAKDAVRLQSFRSQFGDERANYRAALDEHYARVDDGSWRPEFVSFYATAHPWEDFAESWAQVMHVHDVVETGASWNVVLTPGDPGDARAWLDTSVTASVAANELARAMGVRDLYPFALSPQAKAKIEFCWSLIDRRDS